MIKHAFPALFLAAAPMHAVAQTSDLDRIAAHLNAVRSMTATFSQTGRDGRTVGGTLTLKQPGKVRFQYTPGVPLLIVGDGKALTFIDYSARQVSRWPIGQSPLSVLLDPKRNLAGIARIMPSNDPRTVIAEARDPKRPEFGTLTLAFQRDAAAPAGLRLQGWVAQDAQSNRTTVRLANQRFNVPVGDEAFRWRDPRGVGPRR